MFRSAGIPGRIVSILSGTFLCFCIIPSAIFAESAVKSGATTASSIHMPWESGGTVSYSAVATVHFLIGEEMEEAYGLLAGAVSYINWQHETGGTWRFGGGILFGSGDPFLPDTTWNVSSSELQMGVIPVEGAFLYQFNNNKEKAFSPYVGVGAGGVLGFERIAVDMSRAPEGEFDWHDTRFRYTLGGHALLGASLKIGGKISGILEVRWTQSGKGSTVENTFSDQEIAEGWLALENAVRRPDFNFTGWSVSLGARW